MKIGLHEHEPAWKNMFAEERDRLEELFYPNSYAIEHIGSTAVQSLRAKPVIDIMVGVSAIEELDVAARLLGKPGYIHIKHYEDEMPWRRFFVKVKDPTGFPLNVGSGEETPFIIPGNNTHHIHIVRHGKRFWNEHLLFRDYLRKHKEARLAYTFLKQKLAEQEWKDGDDYAAAKTNFIHAVLQKARYEG